MNWNEPTTVQFALLHEALLAAYPTPGDFDLFSQLRLGQGYNPIGGTHDQGLLRYLVSARAAGELEELVHEAWADKPKSPKLLKLRRSQELTAISPELSVGPRLEDIVRREFDSEDLFLWTDKLELAASRVCRIEYPVNQAQGTGWLVGPDLVLTNWHVLRRAIEGLWDSSRVALRFDYAVTEEADLPGAVVKLAPNGWLVDSSPASPSELRTGDQKPTGEMLDYALVRLERELGKESPKAGAARRGWFPVEDPEPRPKAGDILFIVQHPDGEPVKIAVGAAGSSTDDGLRLFHTTNTIGGSSGSPVLDAKLRVVALHHAGDVLYVEGGIGAPEKNQAIPIGLIRAKLAERGKPPIGVG